MMKRKYLAILLCLALSASGLAGCSGGTDTEDGMETGNVPESAAYEGGVYGEVSAVGEDILTIKLATIESPYEDKTEEGAVESVGESGGAADVSSQNEESEAPASVSDENSSAQKDIGLTLTGQEVAIQLRDDAVIESMSINSPADRKDDTEVDSETIALEDISDGDIVSIILDEKGYAETITVLSFD